MLHGEIKGVQQRHAWMVGKAVWGLPRLNQELANSLFIQGKQLEKGYRKVQESHLSTLIGRLHHPTRTNEQRVGRAPLPATRDRQYRSIILYRATCYPVPAWWWW